MQVDYIRRDTPEEISENGGAYIQIVNKSTIGLKSSIKEAKDALYVVGADSMIEGYFTGLMRSVFEGIQADGHPRTVGTLTFKPLACGPVDLDKGWDPTVNSVRIGARLQNGITLVISDWTFNDVTPGRVAFSIDTVSDGEVAGRISTDTAAHCNGRNFPSADKLTVTWVCGEKSGTVPADKFTASVSRVTIDPAAFASLDASDDGKAITIVIKGCYNKAEKTVTCHYVSSDPVVTAVHQEGHDEGEIARGIEFTVIGNHLEGTTVSLTMNAIIGGKSQELTEDCTVISQTDTTTVAKYEGDAVPSGEGQDYMTVAVGGVLPRTTYPVKYVG